MATHMTRIDKWDEMRFKENAEYEKTVNGVEIWSAKTGYRLFKRRSKELFYAGAFSPLRYAEEKANDVNL